MKRSRVLSVVAGVGLALGATGVAVSVSSAQTGSSVTVTAVQTIKMKPNRYLQDGLRWNRDVYRVRSGGTLTARNAAPMAGPHTLTAVRRSDLPRTAAQVFRCQICERLGQAHGAPQDEEGPPTFPFLENGVGQATPPVFDRVGDSASIGPRRGDRVSMRVGARRGTRLYLICLIHPWQQARLDVR